LVGLNDTYKKGKIDIEQYAKQKIELEAEIKKEAQSIKVLQQATAANNSSMAEQKALLASLIQQRNEINRSTDDGVQKFNQLNERIKTLNQSLLESEKAGGTFSRNVGNYKKDIHEFAEGVEIGELSLGRFINRFAFLASPATAAAAAITGLGAAYASSAAGGKDLEETQNRIKAQWEVFSGSIGGEIGEGEGLISTVTKYVLGIGKGFIAAAGDVATFGQGGFIKAAEDDEKQVEKVAVAYNKITELQFEQMRNEVVASKQRKEAYELVQQREDKEKLITERLEVANRIVELQKKSVENNVEALKQQAQQLVIIGDLTNNNVLDEKNISSLRKQYLQILVSINAEEAARARRISQAEVAARNLTNEIKKQNDELAKQNRDEKFGAIQGKAQAEKDLNSRNTGTLIDAGINTKIINAKIAADSLKKIDADYTKAVVGSSKARQEEERREDEDHRKMIEQKVKSDRAYVKSSRELENAARTILGENTAAYKTFATANAIMATYAAGDKALEEVPFPANIAAAAGVIAEGLANVVQINKVKFSDGGYTGDGGKYQPAGIVHAGEVVWSQKDVAAVGGPFAANSMRPTFKGYAEGGLVTSQMSSSVNRELSMGNMFKNMPAPVISWKEGLIVDSRIKFKEGLTRK
jgi:hypothetical protein